MCTVTVPRANVIMQKYSMWEGGPRDSETDTKILVFVWTDPKLGPSDPNVVFISPDICQMENQPHFFDALHPVLDVFEGLLVCDVVHQDDALSCREQQHEGTEENTKEATKSACWSCTLTMAPL